MRTYLLQTRWQSRNWHSPFTLCLWMLLHVVLAPVKLIIITLLRRLFCKELEWQLNILKCKQNNLSISSLLVETKVSQIELCFSSLDKCFPIVKILCSLIYEVPTNISWQVILYPDTTVWRPKMQNRGAMTYKTCKWVSLGWVKSSNQKNRKCNSSISKRMNFCEV